MSILKNLKNKQLNLGGGRFIEICESQVAPDCKCSGSVISENLQPNPNNWFTFQFPKNTLHFYNDINYAGARPTFSPVIKCTVAKDEIEKLNLFFSMIGKRYVIIYHSRNNQKLVIGSRQTPARFFWTDRDHKQNRTSRNEYTFEFRLKALLRPTPFYTYTAPQTTQHNPNQVLGLNGQPTVFLSGQQFVFMNN